MMLHLRAVFDMLSVEAEQLNYSETAYKGHLLCLLVTLCLMPQVFLERFFNVAA